jgi:hypothetical protein
MFEIKMSLSNDEIKVIDTLVTASVAHHHQMMKMIATSASTEVLTGSQMVDISGRILY